MNKIFYMRILLLLFHIVIAAPQHPEPQEPLEVTEIITETPEVKPETADSVKVTQENVALTKVETNQTKKVDSQNVADVTFSVQIYRFFADPIIKVIGIPKVNSVLRNIGTCFVNGAMELFSYYLPPAFMPLIASTASLMIPFEPVVMLKERMPVTSYRRAIKTAMSSFLKTFDQYKVDDDYDPYMTRRFNRRFMGDDANKKKDE